MSHNPPMSMHLTCNERRRPVETEMKDIHSCTRNRSNPWPGKQNHRVLSGGISHAFLTTDCRLLHQWLWKVAASHATAHLHPLSASDIPLVSSEFSLLHHPSHLVPWPFLLFWAAAPLPRSLFCYRSTYHFSAMSPVVLESVLGTILD